MLHATLHENEIRQAIGLAPKGDRVVEGVAQLGAAQDRCLYFVNKPVSADIIDSLAPRCGCIIIVPVGSPTDGLGECIVLEVNNPRLAIANVLQFIAAERRQRDWVSERKVAPGAVISPFAVVDQLVEIGEGAIVEPFCVVDADVIIGRGSVLRSGVRVHSRVAIGEESIIGANTVIGHQGYGFARDDRGNKTRIPHLGGVVIGSHVEIGALVTVASGTITPTTIEDRTKIDDHVHVGHNVHIARSASVTAGVIIAGSAVIAEEAWVGINASIRDGRRVGRRSLVGMDASVQHDLNDSSVARAPRPEVEMRSDDDGSAIGFA